MNLMLKCLEGHTVRRTYFTCNISSPSESSSAEPLLMIITHLLLFQSALSCFCLSWPMACRESNPPREGPRPAADRFDYPNWSKAATSGTRLSHLVCVSGSPSRTGPSTTQRPVACLRDTRRDELQTLRSGDAGRVYAQRSDRKVAG